MRKTTLVLTLLFATISAWGQVATGSIAGLVTDANGASVPGATVTVKNEATGQEVKATSSESGLYSFPALGTGIYVATVEKTGFKRVSRANLEVRIAQRIDMDVKLEIGDVQQTVCQS